MALPPARARGPDGVMRRRRDGGLERLLHVEGTPAIVRVGQPARDRVVLVAGADSPDVAEEALRRMRFALGVDDDLRPFYDRFRADPLIGRSVRARPHLRVIRRPEPFEALAWAICEQLIEFERAAAIQRRIVAAAGPALRDAPACATCRRRDAGRHGARPAAVARPERRPRDRAAARRARGGRGRADLRDPTTSAAGGACARSPASAAGRSRCWPSTARAATTSCRPGTSATCGSSGGSRRGNPRARATEDEVRAFFAPYEGWAGLAGMHLLGKGAS